jgi:hypothetical protein
MFDAPAVAQTGANRVLKSSEMRQGSQSPQPGRSEPTLLWCGLGAFFAAQVFGYPLLTGPGSSLSLRYLVSLGSSLLLFALLALVVGVAYTTTTRQDEDLCPAARQSRDRRRRQRWACRRSARPSLAQISYRQRLVLTARNRGRPT